MAAVGNSHAGLPLLVAVWGNSKGIEVKLAQTAGASLSAAKADWARVTVTGRNLEIEGDAPGRIAMDEVVNAVFETPAARRADATQAKVVPAIRTVASNRRIEIKFAK